MSPAFPGALPPAALQTALFLQDREKRSTKPRWVDRIAGRSTIAPPANLMATAVCPKGGSSLAAPGRLRCIVSMSGMPSGLPRRLARRKPTRDAGQMMLSLR